MSTEFVKVVSLSGKLKSSRKQLAELHFDCIVDSLGERIQCCHRQPIALLMDICHVRVAAWENLSEVADLDSEKSAI